MKIKIAEENAMAASHIPSDQQETPWLDIDPLVAATILNCLPIAVWIVDEQYRLVVANTAYHHTRPTCMPATPQVGDCMLPDDSLPKCRVHWQKQYEHAVQGEHRIFTIDGITYYFQPVTIKHVGKGVLVCTVQDTTLNLAIEAMPDPFGIYTALRNRSGQLIDFQIVAVNSAFCHITGYHQHELIGQRLLDLCPHYHEDGTFTDLKQLLKTGESVRRITTFFDRNGKTRTFEVHAGKFNDGFVASWRDITVQHQLEHQIRQQATLLDQIADAVIATDLNYIITSWNRGAERIYGWSAEEVIGKPLGSFLKTQYTNTTMEEAALVLHQTGYWEGEVEQQRRDGQIVPIHAVVVLSRDENGTPTGIVAVNRDISERRHFEQLLMKANQRLEQAIIDARRQAAEILLVNELHDLLQVCHTFAEAADVVAFGLERLFPRQYGYVMVRQAGTANLTLLAQWGDTTGTPAVITIDQCWALRRGLIHRTCPHESIRCAHISPNEHHCTCCVPLVVQGDIFGLLYIAGEELPRSELIVMTGDTIKLALSNLALRATLREQAIIDPLTGLYNRRYLETSLSRELHRAQREQIPLTVAMIDIDHFKQFNDQYGHDAGDTLLRELAVIFREHLRQSDLACRFGGEEFVLILPGVNQATAQTRLQHLREVVQQRQIIFAGAPLRPITISIGYFTCEKEEIEPHILLQRADAALYAAKRSGRNRVIDFSHLQTLSSDERDE